MNSIFRCCYTVIAVTLAQPVVGTPMEQSHPDRENLLMLAENGPGDAAGRIFRNMVTLAGESLAADSTQQLDKAPVPEQRSDAGLEVEVAIGETATTQSRAAVDPVEVMPQPILELLDPGLHGGKSHAGETWVRLWNEDDSFHLWVTGDREMHCIFKNERAELDNKWHPSKFFQGYLFRCDKYAAP